MKGKFASKVIDKIAPYLDSRGRFDINKSELRRIELKEMRKPVITLSKFDLLRNKELNDKRVINNLVNTIFNR